MRMLKISAAALFFVGLSGQAPRPPYAQGQVWEYRTRDGDAGSLLKIQSIATYPAFKERNPIYHISLIGLKFADPGFDGRLMHAPVSWETLDASVIRLSPSKAEFPDADEGIAEWTRAEGGVFTVPVAQIADFIEKTVADGAARPGT